MWYNEKLSPHVETCILLSHKKPDDIIEIKMEYGSKVHTAYIAEVKRSLGLPMYDAPNAVEELKQPRKHHSGRNQPRHFKNRRKRRSLSCDPRCRVRMVFRTGRFIIRSNNIEEDRGDKLFMKNVILFVILEQYADWEGAYLSSALYMLGQGSYEVKTVSLTKDPVGSIGGFHMLPDYDIRSIPADYDALILIGGMSWRNESAKQIKSLAKDCVEKGKVLGGICDASAFLGIAGVLNDVKHTSNDLNDLKQWGGSQYTGEENYILKPAVSDKNIVTANGTAPLEFAKEVMLTLNAAPEDKITEWYLFHKLGCYEAAMPEDATSWNE